MGAGLDEQVQVTDHLSQDEPQHLVVRPVSRVFTLARTPHEPQQHPNLPHAGPLVLQPLLHYGPDTVGVEEPVLLVRLLGVLLGNRGVLRELAVVARVERTEWKQGYVGRLWP